MRCQAQWSDHVVIAQCKCEAGHTGRHLAYDPWAKHDRRWMYGDWDDPNTHDLNTPL